MSWVDKTKFHDNEVQSLVGVSVIFVYDETLSYMDALGPLQSDFIFLFTKSPAFFLPI